MSDGRKESNANEGKEEENHWQYPDPAALHSSAREKPIYKCASAQKISVNTFGRRALPHRWARALAAMQRTARRHPNVPRFLTAGFAAIF